MRALTNIPTLPAARNVMRWLYGGLSGPTPSKGRFYQLDGWRGLSIVLVLAGHLLPLGPSNLALNSTAASAGMALFFCLSGFLITSFLLKNPKVRPFLIRRLCRIVPLAWLALVVLLAMHGEQAEAWIANLLFLENYWHEHLYAYNSHFWSLCLEVHFYLGVALVIAVFGSRGLYVLPLIAVAVTCFRVNEGIYKTIISHGRADELLAGVTLALLFSGRLPASLSWPLRAIHPAVWLAVFFASCNPHTEALQYLRPYFAAMTVGATLYQPSLKSTQLLGITVLSYLAVISYALYVVHGPLRTGWFATGGTIELYLFKRPITIVLSLGLAHLSTFYWESIWIRLGRRLTQVAPVTTNQS